MLMILGHEYSEIFRRFGLCLIGEKARRWGIDLAGSYLSDGPYQPSAELFRSLMMTVSGLLFLHMGYRLREQIAMYLRSNYENL